MAGTARAMSANLTGAQNCLANIKICDLQFLQPLFCAPYNHSLQSCIPLSNH